MKEDREKRKASIYLITNLRKSGYDRKETKRILFEMLMNRKILPSHYLMSVGQLGYRRVIEVNDTLKTKRPARRLERMKLPEILKLTEETNRDELNARIEKELNELKISEFTYEYIKECMNLEMKNDGLIMKGTEMNMKTMTITINNLDEKSLYEALNRQKDKIDYLNYLVALDGRLNDRECSGVINCYETKEVYAAGLSSYTDEALKKEADGLTEQISALIDEIDSSIPALYKGAELDSCGRIDIGEADIASYLKLISDRLTIVRKEMKARETGNESEQR